MYSQHCFGLADLILMKFIVITKDPTVAAAAREGIHPSDDCHVIDDWTHALELAGDADLLFVDMLATLKDPHRIAGYEEFAMTKMSHPKSKGTPLVLISPPDDYDLDFMAGWPDFVLGHIRRPVDYKIFRRASTWV
jgi:hypothetical protein